MRDAERNPIVITIFVTIFANSLSGCAKDAEKSAASLDDPAPVAGAGGSNAGASGSISASSGSPAVGVAGASAAGRGSTAAVSGAGGDAAAGSNAAGNGSTGAAGNGGAGNAAAGSAAGAPAPATAGDLFAAPDGRDTASGTLAEPTTLTAALTRVMPGATIHLRGGTYPFAMQLTIARDNSGTADKLKTVAAYKDEKPILDFSGQPYGKDSNPRGFQIEGSHWHILGLTARGSADNGIYIAGNSNVIERCVTHGNRDTGLQIGRANSDFMLQSDWPSNNLILTVRVTITTIVRLAQVKTQTALPRS
jgi:hypothetical protein